MKTLLILLDFIPVILFTLAGIHLLRSLYDRSSKGAFALLSSGVIIIIASGIYKSLYKLLYYTNICDFEILNKCFFPMQSTGFLLVGIGMLALMLFKQPASLPLLTIIPLYTSSMPFVFMTLIGTTLLWLPLSYYAHKSKHKLTSILFIISYILLLTMGYLSTKNFELDIINLIAELVNIVAQLCFYIGIKDMHNNVWIEKELY